jgi:Tfp pilus assembly protein PilO
MLSTFKTLFKDNKGVRRSARFWLQAAAITLAVLNAAALYLYFDPPGGSREELSGQSRQMQASITTARLQTERLKKISANVQLGGEQAREFEARYFLPKRQAYQAILSEIQRMAQAANLQQRDATWNEEPIEGSDDLSVLTNQVNFEGSYTGLMKFLYEVDHSPQMLMLDTLTASPQKAGQITATVRFQAVIREAQTGGPAAGLQ